MPARHSLGGGEHCLEWGPTWASLDVRRPTVEEATWGWRRVVRPLPVA